MSFPSHSQFTKPESVALVIGGSSGFGLAITRHLQNHGFATITIGRSLVVDNVLEHHSVDVSQRRAWHRFLAAIAKRSDLRLSCLIYTIGYARVYPFQQTPAREWDRHLWMNFTHIAESYPILEALLLPQAKIATTGSQWSHQNGWSDLIPYIAAKHALAAVTREYALASPTRAFRHYCVPTMDTEGYRKVVASAMHSGATLHTRSAPASPADPARIASAFVGDLIAGSPDYNVLRDINSEGGISTFSS